MGPVLAVRGLSLIRMAKRPYTINGLTLTFTENSVIDVEIRSFWDEFASPGDTLLCHTSGSTGTPKDLWVAKSAMRYSAGQTIRFFGLGASDTALLCLPVKYIGGRMLLLRAHMAGMTVHAVRPSLNPLADVDDDLRVDFAAFTPAQVWEILKDENTARRLARIKHIIIGGAAVDPALEEQLTALPNALYATYGMTETVSHIALRKLGDTFYVRLSPQTVLETDADGCLRITDPNLAPGPLQTNDVVELHGEDRFVWLGRRDFVINSGGVKLHPEQLEEKIRTWTPLRNRAFFVAAEPHAQYGQRPILVVEGDITGLSPEDLADRLTKVELPARICSVDRFVWTESGKLDRGATLKRLRS